MGEWTSVGLWESAQAMEAWKKSPAHDKIMHKLGALMDVGKMEEHVVHADFHYYEPMRQCNWERYPVEVTEWKVKPGFRKHVQKLIVDNSPLATFCHKMGVHFQVLTYNKAEDHVMAYTVFRDLLKWKAAQGELPKHMVDWGLADFVVEHHHEAKHHEAAHHEAKYAKHHDAKHHDAKHAKHHDAKHHDAKHHDAKRHEAKHAKHHEAVHHEGKHHDAAHHEANHHEAKHHEAKHHDAKHHDAKHHDAKHHDA